MCSESELYVKLIWNQLEMICTKMSRIIHAGYSNGSKDISNFVMHSFIMIRLVVNNSTANMK